MQNQLLTSFILLIVLMSFLSVSGQNKTIFLWEKDQLNIPEGFPEEKHDTTDIIRISRVSNPSMDVYFPSIKNRKDCAIVICPGGGYRILAWNWEGSDFAKKLNSKGITAIVLKYRLPYAVDGKIDDTMPMRDALRAIQIVRTNAEEWGLSEDKIGLMGFSAGGHVASSAGVHFGDQSFLAGINESDVSVRPDFLGLIYPVISFDESFSHVGSRTALLGDSPSSEKTEYYSNEKHVNADTPPTFLMHASDDKGVPVENSLRFYQALVDHKISAEMHIYPTGGHGFGLGLKNPHLSGWSDLLADWILDQTKN